MSQTIKCPSCKADLPAITTICEWCNFVINQEGANSIENISSDLEGIIRSMKEIENPTILSSFNKNAKVSMPLFTIASFLLAYKVNGWFAVLGIIFLVYSIISILKKTAKPIVNLKPLKAAFDEKVRSFQNLYGVNNKYKAQIQQYQNDWKIVENEAKKGKIFEWISYGVLILIFTIAFVIPEPKTNTEKNKDLFNSEAEIMLKVDSLINSNKINLAKNELLNIKTTQNNIEVKSKIQLKELEQTLKSIENKIESASFISSKNELSKVSWIKNSADYDSEQFEIKYYKQYILLKNAVNEKLPEDSKIKVEDEFDF
jgi:hypothetical protein